MERIQKQLLLLLIYVVSFKPLGYSQIQKQLLLLLIKLNKRLAFLLSTIQKQLLLLLINQKVIELPSNFSDSKTTFVTVNHIIYICFFLKLLHSKTTFVTVNQPLTLSPKTP